MVKLLCTQTIFQEQPNKLLLQAALQVLGEVLTIRGERNITSSVICGSVAEFGHLKCVNKLLTFVSLIVGISHHAALTPIQKTCLLISFCISFKLHIIQAVRQRRGKLTMNQSLSPVTYHSPVSYSAYLQARMYLIGSVMEMVLLVSPVSCSRNPTCLQPHTSCVNSPPPCPSAWQ